MAHISVLLLHLAVKGQGGLELWVLRTWLHMAVAQLVLHATSGIIIVKLVTIIGAMQVVVAHGLESSHYRGTILTWWKEFRIIRARPLCTHITTVWLIDDNNTMGLVQSDAVGPHHPEQEPEACAEFHSLLTTWTRFYLPLSTMTPQARELGVPIQASGVGTIMLPSHASTYQQLHRQESTTRSNLTSIQLDINLHVDHLLTQVTVHIPTANTIAGHKSESGSKFKARRPSRASLKIPAIKQAMEDDIAAMPPPRATWSVDEHDRLLTILFRTVWF